MPFHFKSHGGTLKIDSSELSNIEFEDKCVECINSKKIYRDAKHACSDLGISYLRMKRVLDGELDHVRGHVYAKLKFRYSDKRLDVNGNVIEE